MQAPRLPIQSEAQPARLPGIFRKCLPSIQPWPNPAPSIAERSRHHEVETLTVLTLLALLATDMESWSPGQGLHVGCACSARCRMSGSRLKEAPTIWDHRLRTCFGCALPIQESSVVPLHTLAHWAAVLDEEQEGQHHNIPSKLALLDEPPEASMSSGRSFGAVFQVAVDVQGIWRQRSLLLLQIGAEFSPSLESIQHRHWLSQGNHLLGKAIQLLSPQSGTSSIHALQWAKDSSFTEGLPQSIDSKLHLLRSKTKATLRSQARAHRTTVGHSHLQLDFTGTRGLRSPCLSFHCLDNIREEIVGLFTLLPDTQPVTGDMVAGIHDRLLEAAKSKGKVIVCHQAHLLPPLGCPHRLRPLLRSLSR